ncbi:zinc finger HIT domain-containing protein 2 [Pelobates fuscus]|uniref:zinc finger HIT domain-containing protein 2 n=1 Tax=Pelobates fuscus TaxID=191477 RepID=UPI002FE4E7D4
MAAPSPDILLPARSSSPEPALSPAAPEDGGGHGRVCSLCLSRPGIYTCPRCNGPYCSLPCYRGPRHTACSEDFYREAVLRVLREEVAGPGGRREMEDILLRMKREEEAGRHYRGLAEGEEEDGIGGTHSEGEAGMGSTHTPSEGEAGMGSTHSEGEAGMGSTHTPSEGEAGIGGPHTPSEGEAGLMSTHTPSEVETAMWNSLSDKEKEDFKRLLKSGDIGALVPEWIPWWVAEKGTSEIKNTKIVELPNAVSSGDRIDGDHEVDLMNHLQEENNSKSVTSDSLINSSAEEINEIVSISKGEMSTFATSHLVNSVDHQEREEQRGILPDTINIHQYKSCLKNNLQDVKEECTGNVKQLVLRKPRVKIKEDAPEEVANQPKCSGIPLPFISIPPLSSLSRNPSQLVQFSVVNALYGYAFSLLRHNGDLTDEDILLDFTETLLGVSATLSSTVVYNSTADALQSAVRVASDQLLSGDQVGACSAMEATSKILQGDGSKTFPLAALAHMSRVLGKARKLVSQDKHLRQVIFNAKKKCLFLAAWANENEDCLPMLSEAVKIEHQQHLQYVNGLTEISRGIEKVWGGKRPPEKKSLIEEVGSETT